MNDVAALCERLRTASCDNAWRTEYEGLLMNASIALLALESERSQLSAEVERKDAALREATDFLNHSGNQRAILSGKFTTPSARYDWFVRVRDGTRAALAPLKPPVKDAQS